MSATTSVKTRPIRLLAIAACIISIAACSTVPRPVPGPDLNSPAGIEANAQQLLLNGKFDDAAAQYATLSRLATDPAIAQHYALVEAEILFAHQLEEKGASRTAELPTEMAATELQSRRQLLQSASELYNQLPENALLSLPDPRLMADHDLLIRYHDLRFRAGAALNEGTPMFDSLIALDELEEGEHRDLRNNQIWQLLNSRSALSLEQLNANASTNVHTGWLALLNTLRTVRNQGQDYRSSVATWQTQYFDHPGSQLLENHDADIAQLMEIGAPTGNISLIGSDAIALLLPFNDRLAKISNAIRDGLLSAMYEGQNSREIRIYDIGKNPSDALSTYQQAVADGAQLVIGPLRRSALDTLVRYGDLSVPVVGLNYLAYGGAENLIQFGLSPEDEARDAVSYMVQAGLSTAAMILPDTEAGARSGEAFKQQLERWGGEVVASEVLDSTRSDYRKELSGLLLINDSLQRRRNIQAALDTSLVFETRTRNDLDAIFAPVSPAIGRVLKPQLDFHGAGDIPLLASSSIYSGSPQPDKDNDLNGTLFNDIPWLIAPRLRSESNLHNTASKLSLDKGPLSRFFAMGVDAFRITDQLGEMLASPDHVIEGATGRLQLTSERRIRRQLAWAEFQSGSPKAVSFDYTPVEPPMTGSLIDMTQPPIPSDTNE